MNAADSLCRYGDKYPRPLLTSAQLFGSTPRDPLVFVSGRRPRLSHFAAWCVPAIRARRTDLVIALRDDW